MPIEAFSPSDWPMAISGSLGSFWKAKPTAGGAISKQGILSCTEGEVKVSLEASL